jgi:SAM-dependent methyltransferase
VKGLSSRESPEIPWRVGWCCSYCSAPLELVDHGLVCPAEDRWFATDRGVHRLLPQERRQELLPALELDLRARRDARDPDRERAAARRLDEALRLATVALGAGPWRVLDAGAGSCWASLHLAGEGHSAVAVDATLDAELGLFAAAATALPRAEAEMEALPLEPGLFDLVLAVGSLHYASRLSRALVELRRVTRKGGLLLAFGSPVFRRREDGEAAVARRMRDLSRRYGFAVTREVVPGTLVLDELPELFRTGGWRLEVHGWPGRAAERLADAARFLRGRRPDSREPILVARREG